jgi:hypothetical protein
VRNAHEETNWELKDLFANSASSSKKPRRKSAFIQLNEAKECPFVLEELTIILFGKKPAIISTNTIRA